MTDDDRKIQKSVRRLQRSIVFVWLVQLAVVILKLIGKIDWSWLWVLSVSWISILFWFSMVAGVLLFDKIGIGKRDD